MCLKQSGGWMIKSGLNIKEKWCFCYLKKFNTEYLSQKWIWYLDINSEKHKMNSQKLTVPLCETKRQNLHQQKNYSEYTQCHWTVSVEKKIAQCTRYMLLLALHSMRKKYQYSNNRMLFRDSCGYESRS